MSKAYIRSEEPVCPDGYIIFQYLAMLNSSNLPKIYKNCKTQNKPSKVCLRFLKYLVKWQNFAKSGHADQKRTFCTISSVGFRKRTRHLLLSKIRGRMRLTIAEENALV